MKNGLTLIKTAAPPSMLGYLGDIKDVLAAKFPFSLRQQRFKASDYAYGFEIASIDYENALGEAMLLNNYCYTTSTAEGTAHYYQLRTAQDFITSSMFIIPRTCQAGWIAHYPVQNKSLSFPDFYLKLIEKIKAPLGFVALVEFEDLKSIAIAKPPINGQAVFEHTDYYYPFPATMDHGIPAVVIGVLTDYANPAFQTVNQQLESVLYNNPMDNRAFPLTHHAHVLTLEALPSSLLEVNPAMAKEVRHLVIGESNIRSLYAEIFPIHSITNLFPGR
jgi:hypothetical protein